MRDVLHIYIFCLSSVNSFMIYCKSINVKNVPYFPVVRPETRLSSGVGVYVSSKNTARKGRVKNYIKTYAPGDIEETTE